MIAQRLSEKGLSGKEIAEKMGLTPAAVTHYLHKSRGCSQLENKRVETVIDRLVDNLMKEALTEKEKVVAFCEVCKIVREEKLICDLHQESSGVEDCCLCS